MKILRFVWKRCPIDWLIQLTIISVVLLGGIIGYGADRGLHATPNGYEALEPVLIEEIKLIPLNQVMDLNDTEKTVYVVDSGSEDYIVYHETESDFSALGEKVYSSKKILRTAKIIETDTQDAKYQLYKTEYKGIASFWSWALKSYEEYEEVHNFNNHYGAFSINRTVRLCR